MQRELLIFVAVIFSTLVSCNKGSEKSIKESYYVISVEDSINQINFPIEHPAFGDMNFLLADSNRVFYYRTIAPMICVSSDGKIPPFTGLDVKDLIELPNKCLEDFVLLNYQRQENFNLISVASKSDTIKSKNFKILMSGFAKAKVKQYYIRRTTHEEETVLDYKIKRKPYSPDEIKWDTTRIFFDKK